MTEPNLRETLGLTGINMDTDRDKIKAAIQNCKGTPTRKLIAVLSVLGITSSREISSMIGISERAIRKAKTEPQFRGGGTTVPQKRNHSSGGEELQFRKNGTTVPGGRNYSSENGTTVPGRARVDNNNIYTNLDTPTEISKNPLPPTKTKFPSATDALDAFNAYNAAALQSGLPQAAKLTPDRKRKIIARLKDYGRDGWTMALENIARSSFLTGENDRGWRANLDFLLQPASFAKVVDGAFGNGRHAPMAPAGIPAWRAEKDRKAKEFLELCRSYSR